MFHAIGSKEIIAASIIAFAIGCACLFRSEQPPAQATVCGFVTNQYTFFPGDYVCAVINVTNTSRYSLSCSLVGEHRIEGRTGHTGPLAPMKPYYAFREGAFKRTILPSHSGFSFEALVFRNVTNQITLKFYS